MPLRQHYTITAIIAVASVVFVVEHFDYRAIVDQFGAVPLAIVTAWQSLLAGSATADDWRALATLFTATLVHADLEHILLNCVMLWVFGSLVSQHLGPWWSLAVFVVTGMAGNLLQVALEPDSPAPIIGASGALCGFEGMYLALALRWPLRWPDVWPLAHAIPPLQLAALGVVGFFVDVYSQLGEGQGIAYGAHMGGFVSGFFLACVLTSIYPTEQSFSRHWLKKRSA